MIPIVLKWSKQDKQTNKRIKQGRDKRMLLAAFRHFNLWLNQCDNGRFFGISLDEWQT